VLIPDALSIALTPATGQSAVNELRGRESLQRADVARDPTSPELHGALGQTLLQEGKYEEAVKELGIAAEQIPDSLVYNMGLAEALIGWGHFGVAEEFLRAVQSRFMNTSRFHYDLGLAEYNLDRSREAEEEFKETLRIDPKQERAKLLLAGCLGRNGDLAGAAARLQPLAEDHPKEATYWVALAEVLGQMDSSRLPEALRASRHALALKPEDPAIQFRTAVILLKMQDYAAARPLLERFVKLAPDYAPAHIALATTYSHLGDHDSAHAESAIAARLAKQQSAPQNPTPGQP
jgi:predicted Zn-dependent protease